MIRFLHQLASILGDVKAASRGPGAYGRRVVRQKANRAFNRKLRRWVRP